MKKIGKILFEALKFLFKKPVTSEYPYKKRSIHDSIAGMISFEQPKCIGCNMCVRNCPANAIKITKVADKVFGCVLSLANCIFCSQCVLSCPKKALHTTDNFELAQIDKSKLTVKLEELAVQTESVGPIKQQEIQTAKNNAADASAAVKKEEINHGQPVETNKKKTAAKVSK
jgi:formate hydrogenlyase subunit 6/NADH:ubiquinone oxidoreductase subunit I